MDNKKSTTTDSRDHDVTSSSETPQSDIPQSPIWDVESWGILCRFRGGLKRSYPVTEEELDRFKAVMRLRGSDDGFFVVDSRDRIVAINLNQITFYHALFSPGAPPKANTASGEARRPTIRAYMADNGEKLDFIVDDDELDMDDHPEADIECQLQHLLFMAEVSDEEELLHFTDIDGEDAYLRAGDVAALEVLRSAVSLEQDTDSEDSEVEESESQAVLANRHGSGEDNISSMRRVATMQVGQALRSFTANLVRILRRSVSKTQRADTLDHESRR